MDYEKLADEMHQKLCDFKRIQNKMQIGKTMEGEIFVLLAIASQDDDLLPGKLREMIDISSARIANVLSSLEKKKFIIREIDKNDRRKILVRLTPEGKTFADEKHREIKSEVAGMLQKLGEHDAKEFVRILGKLSEIKPELRQ